METVGGFLGLVVILVLVVIYRKLLFRTAELSEKIVSRTLDATDDSMETYVNVVHIANNKKRQELMDELLEMDIVTNKDISDILKGKEKDAKEAKAE